MLDGVLFFPVTPFTATGEVDHPALAEHVSRGVTAGPGGVFVACGTGEFHALDIGEYAEILATTMTAVRGRAPVFAGAGGSIAAARHFARAAADAGVDGILLLPPYLVQMPQQGLIDYVTAVAAETDRSVIVYHRGNARFTEASAVTVAQLPTVIGVKDGVGDVDLMSRIVIAVSTALEPSGKPFQFFNGLPTAEASQRAYRAIGVPLYSSATFAFAPDIALAFYRALEQDDDDLLNGLLREFYGPLVRLRDQVPGYAVALIKAGVQLEGHPAGSVRPPLVDATPEHVEELARILAAGRAVLADAASTASAGPAARPAAR
jgi:5-dehydro-4-deoxyglucarate dehydratase